MRSISAARSGSIVAISFAASFAEPGCSRIAEYASRHTPESESDHTKPPESILTRLRQLGPLKLQPRELLAALRELALQYKAYLSGNAVS
jgi:hypothetical protein